MAIASSDEYEWWEEKVDWDRNPNMVKGVSLQSLAIVTIALVMVSKEQPERLTEDQHDLIRNWTLVAYKAMKEEDIQR